MIIRLEPDEKLLAETRRHWLVLVMDEIGVLLAALAPFALILVLNILGLSIADKRILPLWLFFTAAWWLMLWILFWTIWTAYYLDVWYVTDRRIIDVEQHWLFSREVSECRLEKIQDITVEVRGLFAHIFRFGNIHVQTAGQAREFKISSIPEPHALKEIIWDLHRRVTSTTPPSQP